MTRPGLVALLVLGCGAPTTPSGTGSIHLVGSGLPDTVRFVVPVVANACAEGRGLLMHGARRGQGVLVWLRDGWSPDTGAYPLVPRADSAATRGAIVAVRFLVGDVTHGLSLDDGSATVTRATEPFAVHVRGIGVEMARAEQRTAELTLERVPLAADTVPCRTQP